MTVEQQTEELSKEQKIGKKFLEKLTGVFKRQEKVQISRILVYNTRQTFWVKNKKKIKFWMGLARNSATVSLNMNTVPSVHIKKVIYEDGREE